MRWGGLKVPIQPQQIKSFFVELFLNIKKYIYLLNFSWTLRSIFVVQHKFGWGHEMWEVTGHGFFNWHAEHQTKSKKPHNISSTFSLQYPSMFYHSQQEQVKLKHYNSKLLEAMIQRVPLQHQGLRNHCVMWNSNFWCEWQQMNQRRYEESVSKVTLVSNLLSIFDGAWLESYHQSCTECIFAPWFWMIIWVWLWHLLFCWMTRCSLDVSTDGIIMYKMLLTHT